MSFNRRAISVLSVLVMLLAACGGSDSSSRTKNSALCYATQEEKDAAVQAARDAFDAAMGSVVTEEQPEGVPTSTTVSEEQPEVISETTVPGLEEAFGGGYRRPAVRAASSGDTSTTVAESGDGGEVALTPEQQQAQMDLEAAEAQPLCESDSEGAAEVTCTATIALESVSDDCEDGDVRVDGTQWELVGTDESGAEAVFAFGPYDASIITAESPLVFPITYGGSGESGESSSDACTATFTSTGVSWNCPNGELFDVVIEDMSNPGVYPLSACASSGELTASGTDRYWFNFNLGTSFFDGWADEQEQNVPVEFSVPGDWQEYCSPIDIDNVDWEGLPFAGQSDLQVSEYRFEVPENFDGAAFVKFESSEYFDVDIDDESDFEQDVTCEESCIGYSVWNLSPGQYVFEIEDNEEIVTWKSNIEISPVSFEFPQTAYSYETDGSLTLFELILEEPSLVTLTATAGQTCNAWQDDAEGNGFADPEIYISDASGNELSDDNSGRGLGNCSASVLTVELDSGTYNIQVEDDDNEGFSVVLGSSVELQEKELKWKETTVEVTDEKAVEFDVPEGGMWFKADAYTNQLETYLYNDRDSGDEVDSGGCANPDNDFATNDDSCVMTFMQLLQGEDVYISADIDEYQSWAQIGNQWQLTWVNSYGTTIQVFLPAGSYVLVASGRPAREGNNLPSNFSLTYGFGSAEDVAVTEVDVPQGAEPGNTAALPVNAIASDSRTSVAIATTVEEFVCDSDCIAAMFDATGIAAGTLEISAGGEKVSISKGQQRATIPVGKGAGEISVVAKSNDGSAAVQFSSSLVQVPESVQSSIANKASTSNGGSGFNLAYLLILLPVVGALALIIRRKQTAASAE